MQSTCFFNHCHNPVEAGAWKCIFHKHRGRCLVQSCRNQMYARDLCIRHGGKRQCTVDNCDRNVRIGELCALHGTLAHKELRCTEPHCTSVAHNRHKCVKHGGGRQCKAPQCTRHPRAGGYCCRHARHSHIDTIMTMDDSGSESEYKDEVGGDHVWLEDDDKLDAFLSEIVLVSVEKLQPKKHKEDSAKESSNVPVGPVLVELKTVVVL
ncbi:Aste57867_11494 [Aphanomyces stellatus]|uniref:Aste57867_11494 protein n=1 Tax=Aphanomyces stellatus TaxID=120398 RepID=A0A485KV06_9STRA|nr:hypothetical protein As57867_011451 [Aphanomyces stellatus]VFT88355.1 Aste57867_11494 [Aphanomyces stellatus]